MGHAGRKRQPNGPGQLGWGLAHVYFLCFSICLQFCSSSPNSASIVGAGVGGVTLFLDPFYIVFSFLCSFLLDSFLGVVARRLRGRRIRCMVPNN